MSSTGRISPESVVFKVGVLPLVVILVLFWSYCSSFLDSGRRSRLRSIALRTLAVITALSMLLYAMNLGAGGEDYRRLRRIGINGFAICNFTAQVIFIVAYRHLRSDKTVNMWCWLIILCAALPLLGIGAQLAQSAGVERHAANNVTAWNSLLLQCAFYTIVYRLWRYHKFPGQSENRSFGRAASPRE